MREKLLKLGICLTIFFLPLYLIRFKIFAIPTNVLELIIVVVFIFWLRDNHWKRLINFIKENRLLFWAIFLILFGVSLATYYSWDIRTSAGILKSWFLIPVLYFVIFITVLSCRDFKKVVLSFLFSGFGVSVIALVYIILNKLNQDRRLQAFYNSPNYLAMYLVPVLVLGLFWIFFGLRNRRFFKKTELSFYASFVLVVFLTILFTGSFGAWLGLVSALSGGLILSLFKNKKLKLALLFIVCLIGFLIGAYFLKTNSQEGRLSIASRLEIWQRAVDAVLLYPIIGIGPGTFRDFFPPFPLWGVPQPHSLYLAFLLQTGIIGFVGFALLLIWFFRGLKLFEANEKMIIALTMFSILVHGLVDATYWKNDLSIMFWALIGTMYLLKEKNYQQKQIIN